MKKALIVSTVVGFITSFELNDIKILQELGYSVEVASNVNVDDGDAKVSRLNDMDVVVHDIHFSRTPFSANTIKAYKELKKLIKTGEYYLIHCHTPVAGILTRLAAKKSRERGVQVIYTAHGFHFFKGAPLKNWLLYYPIEKLCAKYTDLLITMNHEDFALAKEKFKAKEIKYIPGIGIDTDTFANILVDKKIKRVEVGLNDDDVMLLSVGELIKRKNHEIIIKAIAKINNKNIKYFIAGRGDRYEYLSNLIKKSKLENQVFLLGFRTDIAELCKLTDIYCFPSFQEGLPVALMEAMASGLPCVVSEIRGNRDLISNIKGGYLVNPIDVNGFAQGINILISDRCKIESFGSYNKTVIEKFDIKNVEIVMREIYGEKTKLLNNRK